MISYEDFMKMDIRIGTIKVAEKVPETDKLVKLIFDFGNEERQIISGIAHAVDVDSLVGKQMPVLVNLEAKKLRGFESQGMILAADDNGLPVLLHPAKDVPLGSTVR